MDSEIKKKYKDVEQSLEDAMIKANKVVLTGDDENSELTAIKNTLSKLNVDFKKDIDELESSSVWDKFCIVFFGETNAGKSTIIDSLRILYDEESRRLKLLEQKDNYYDELKNHLSDYSDMINSLEELLLFVKDKKNRQTKVFTMLICIGCGLCGIAIGWLVAQFGIFVW